MDEHKEIGTMRSTEQTDCNELVREEGERGEERGRRGGGREGERIPAVDHNA